MKKTKWTASPYLVWTVAFIAVPLAIVVYFAFTDKAGHFTLENIMGLGAYTTVFARSIVLAAIATAICLVLAFPVSYLLSRMRLASQRMMQMLIMLPMWMNFLLRTYAWMTPSGAQRHHQPLSGAAGRRAVQHDQHLGRGGAGHGVQLPALYGAAAVHHHGQN